MHSVQQIIMGALWLPKILDGVYSTMQICQMLFAGRCRLHKVVLPKPSCLYAQIYTRQLAKLYYKIFPSSENKADCYNTYICNLPCLINASLLRCITACFPFILKKVCFVVSGSCVCSTKIY